MGNSIPFDWWMVRNGTQPLGTYSVSSSYSLMPPCLRNLRYELKNRSSVWSMRAGVKMSTLCRYSNLPVTPMSVERLRTARWSWTPPSSGVSRIEWYGSNSKSW